MQRAYARRCDRLFEATRRGESRGIGSLARGGVTADLGAGDKHHVWLNFPKHLREQSFATSHSLRFGRIFASIRR